ncbi:uncharacterized protein LOC107429642 isoform X1 [Ziziphus jujuba]|uniref:Uncharacterized protein LOC107429642 isoform X1 n=1 Tax=Ziziphus jujuba TaxID=326968 RepID=A0A6P4B1X8_ZIZJJ|nr:uncharacterized protein LOC107429642 isoform X1 [Ziziphus jujuba]XP_015895852.2 uncharacterized protein LOC107429642 isoform X1 [Ziziphus jujuba]XP_015895854.2 uncharacterized protein LOC107429642 isoform X1 [Ziziphus jujuba]XP_015895855.2 uncharacterized protein LOC107429642 isoform X1 [Ziziphus jujuba]XP_048318636.1 uncharacterized protein LOC107429642 isoform X1 [Ziziphus jujuba]
MATESNTGFHCEGALGSALNRHAISFQSGAINSTSEMLQMGYSFGVNSNTAAGMMFTGNSTIIGNNPVISQAGSSSGALLLDSVPGLKHDVGLAVEWSVEEQYKLEEGLARYADEPSIMRYIKIAATLRDKTVRDVALRCRWMMRKRRKPDEHNVGKKVINRKDKLLESSSKMNMPSALPLNMGTYPFMLHNVDQNGCMPSEVSGLSGTAKHLLEQNAQAFSQISSNLSTYKLQDNIDLFCRTRNNLIAILDDMRDMPGMMREMPLLPVSINEDLANSILPNPT